MSRKLTQEEVIRRFKETHGDTYDYSQVVFERTSQKVKIVCKIHERVFLQLVHHHANGSGCPHCGIRSRAAQPYYEYDGVKYCSLKELCNEFNLESPIGDP